jgi:hypothetical protein
MKLQIRVPLLLMSLLLTIAAASATISTDYDHKANFANYKTYSWGKVQTANSLWDQRVKDAIDGQLAAKGWTLVPSGGDVIVNAFGKTHAEHTLNTFYDGFGGGYRWRGFGGFGTSTTTVDTYKVGTLVVDIFDANSKNLVWRGTSSDTLSSNPDKNTKKLNNDARKMFEHFPPNSSR